MFSLRFSSVVPVGLLVVVLFLSACGGEEESTDHNDVVSFHDGAVTVELKAGYSGTANDFTFDGRPACGIVNETNLLFSAANAAVDVVSPNPDKLFQFTIFGVQGVQTYQASNQLNCMYVVDDAKEYGNVQSMTVTITEYGDVGSYVKGTFSAVLSNAVDSTIMHLSDGKFSVKRIADGKMVD